MSGYDLAQTFYVDPGGCMNAPSVSVTGIDLYFFTKPVKGKSMSNIYAPGVTVFMCSTKVDGTPDLTTVASDSFARVEYDNIAIDPDGGVPTRFNFSRPIQVRTGRKAAFLISFDGGDRAFQLWYNKSGNKQYNTTITSSVHSGKIDGHMFRVTNGQQLTPDLDSDMTFKLYVAQYSTDPAVFKIQNRPYEILKTANTTGKFLGGEPAYIAKANSAGSVNISSTSYNITGTSTNFSSLQPGDYFVLTDGTVGNTIVRQVGSVSNSTLLTITEKPSFSTGSGAYTKTVTGRVYYVSGVTDHIVLQDTTSNSSVYVSVGDTLYGADSLAVTTVTDIEDYNVTAVTPSFVVGLPAGTTVNTSINFANSSYVISDGNVQSVDNAKRKFLDLYPAIIASRTHEVTAGTPIKSFASTLTFHTDNPYISPYVDQNNLDLIVESVNVNNDSSGEENGKGAAAARYVSKMIVLGTDQLAEDLKTTITCYKPANTDIKVYAKFRNSNDIETMDVKTWTQLRAVTPDQLSSSTNRNDFIEIDYVVPFEPAGAKANGTFTVLSGNSVITGTSGAVNTSIATGDVVRVYSPYFSNTYFIATVTQSNTTTFTVAQSVANASILGTGFLVDVLSYPASGYLDVQESNILSYFNTSRAHFQGFDSFAFKVVMLSNNDHVYPRVAGLTSIAVSA